MSFFKRWFDSIFRRNRGPKITTNDSSRMPEIHGWINEAGAALGGLRLKSNLHWEFVPGSKHGRHYAIWSPELRRWVGGLHYPPTGGGGHHVKAAMYPDGRLGPNTGRWEAGRCLLWDNGVKDGIEQEARMRKAGLWR